MVELSAAAEALAAIRPVEVQAKSALNYESSHRTDKQARYRIDFVTIYPSVNLRTASFPAEKRVEPPRCGVIGVWSVRLLTLPIKIRIPRIKPHRILTQPPPASGS